MKKFLSTFAAIAAGFTAQAVTASQTPVAPPMVSLTNEAPANAIPASGQVAVKNASGDVFNFVLKRAEVGGELMAWHSSHASHASHASHSSHYSGR
jgi:hypothetical protein